MLCLRGIIIGPMGKNIDHKKDQRVNPIIIYSILCVAVTLAKWSKIWLIISEHISNIFHKVITFFTK